MKIEIKGELNYDDKATPIILTDEESHNDNFLHLVIEEEEISVSLDDLFAACIAFDAKRSRLLSLEKEMDE